MLGVRVLGAVALVRPDGTSLDLPSAGQRRLLAVLALQAPRRVRSEVLADTLQVTPGALRTTVSRLRSLAGDHLIETSANGYALRAAVDAAEFRRAVADASSAHDPVRAHQDALALWNGPALDEFSAEPWALGDVASLTELHAATRDALADALIAAGRAPEALALAEQQITLHPYRDATRGLSIRALAASGRQADALRAFQAYRTLLADELGTEPSPAVVRIERRVATGWDGIDEPDRGTARPSPDEPEPAAPVVLPDPVGLRPVARFVGRVAQRRQLADELEQARTSTLRTVVIEGESGIGKTSLIADFVASIPARPPVAVVYGRCDPTDAPFQPLRGILADCVAHAPLDLLTEHVARRGGELVSICPQLAVRIPTAPEPTGSDDLTRRFLVSEAAADLLRRVAERSALALVIDDLQWAEPAALAMLRHLARALVDSPVLIVLARREPGEPPSDELRSTLAELDRLGARRLALSGFDAMELEELAEGIGAEGGFAPTAAIIDTVADRTAGNPLYASELVRWLAEYGDAGGAVPASLRDLVWSRVNALGPQVVEVLDHACVLGHEFRPDVLSAMIDHPEPQVDAALDAAVSAGLLVHDSAPQARARFAHALVADALYDDLGPNRRARLHERALRTIEKRMVTPSSADLVQLAHHSVLAGLSDEALDWSVAAGDRALVDLAPAEAARHFGVALEMAEALDRSPDDVADLLVRLGEAQHRAGDPRALGTLDRAQQAAEDAGDDGLLTRAVIAADRGFMRLEAHASEYLERVRRAVDAADPSDVPTYARLLALLAQSLVFTPEADARVEIARRAIDLALADPSPTLIAVVAPPALRALSSPHDGALRARVVAQAIAAAEASDDPRLEFVVHHAGYVVAIEAGDALAAARSIRRMRATVDRCGDARLRWVVALFDAFEITMSGRLEAAEQAVNAALDLGTEIGALDAFEIFAAQAFALGSFAGRHEELLPLVEQAMSTNPGIVAFRLAYGISCSAVGREAEAREILASFLDRGIDAIPDDNLWITSVIGLAVIATEIGDEVAARQLLPAIEPFADQVAFSGVTSQGPIAAYVGKLEALLGRYDDAEQHLLQALSTATDFGWRYHEASTLYAMAKARFDRQGRLDDEARAWLARAAAMCREGGYASWLARIDALGAAAGGA